MRTDRFYICFDVRVKISFFLLIVIFLASLNIRPVLAAVASGPFGKINSGPGSESVEIEIKEKKGSSPAEKLVKNAATKEVGLKSAAKKFYSSSLTAEKRERFKKIISDYRKNKKKADPAYSLYVLGLVRELASDFEAAIETYEKLIKLFPKSKFSNLSKERISECYLGLGNRDAAVENYQQYYKWRISVGKREYITFKLAEIYTQTLTTFEKIIDAYKMAAVRYEFSKNETIEYLVGYFKGFHLLDAHMATFYYRQLLKDFPDGLYRFDALLNMSLVFAYDLSDVETALTMLDRLFEEKSEFADEDELIKIRRHGLLIYGLLSQFHSPAIAAKNAMESYKKILAGSLNDDLAVKASYYLGYYYEHAGGNEAKKGLKEAVKNFKYNPKTHVENYLAEIKNDAMQDNLSNAIAAYLLGFHLGKDPFYSEECAFRASLLIINNYKDTVSVELIAKKAKELIKETRRDADFTDLSNMKLPGVFDKAYSALYAKEKKMYESNQYKKSIETHEEIIEKSGKGPEGEYSMYCIGRIYDEDLKEYEFAVDAYKRFLNEFPDSARSDKVTYQIARIYELSLLDYNEAIKYYEKLFTNGRDQLWVYQAGADLAALYSKPVIKKDAEALKIYQKLLEKVPMREDEVLFKLAEIYEKTPKEAEKAVSLCEKIVKSYPGSMYFDEALNRLLAVHYKDNLADINKKVILAETKKEGNLIEVLNEKLEKEIFVKNFKNALETIEKLKKAAVNTDEVLLLEKRAAEIQIDGMNDAANGMKALIELSKKAENESTLAEILFSLAKTLEEREKDYKKSVDTYEQIINMKELNSKTQMMALFRAGLIYAINLKYYEDAFRCYSMIMSKYPDEARAEKLDAKIANLLNIDINILQRYLKDIDIKPKKSDGETLEVGVETKLQDEKAASTSEAGLLDGLYDYSKKMIGVFNAGKAADNAGGTYEEEELLDSEPSWFSKGGRPDYEEPSWFNKVNVETEYSWFQKPVDLSDIGIIEPSWFKKGGLNMVRQKGDIDEETYKLRQEMTLPPVKSSKSNKYLAYIEANPESPKLPIVYLSLAISYEESGDYEKAIDTCKKITSEFGAYPKIIFEAYERQSSIMAREYGQYDRALFVVRSMQDKYPRFFNDADKLILKIENFRKIKQNDEYIIEHIGDEKSLDLMYENAVLYSEKIQDYNNAIGYLNKCAAYISGETEEIKYKLEIANLYADKLKSYEMAYEELNDIVERFPGVENAGEIVCQAAGILIDNLKQPKKAVKLLEKFRENNKGDPMYKEAMIMLQAAYDEKQVAEKAETIKTLKQVIPELKLSEDVAREFKRIEVEKKVADLMDIMEKNPEDPSNFHYIYYAARMYERDSEDYEKAAEFYNNLLAQKLPADFLIRAITSLGVIYESKLNKPKKAIDLYRSFIVKNVPDDVDFLAYLQFKIGECYEFMKKREEAIDAYKKTGFYFPISRWAKTSDDRVKQILASPDKFVSIRDIAIADEDLTAEVEVKQKGTFEVALETGEISLSSAEIEIASEKDPEIKIEKLNALISSLPEKNQKLPGYLIELAKTCEQAKKLDQAAEALKRIVEEFPKYPRYFDVVLKLAEMYKIAGNMDEAVRFYKQIVQESPQYDKTEYVRYTLGTLYIQKQEYIYALEVFQELIDRYQDSLYAKKAQYEKGLVNERYMKDYDAAILDFENMVSKYFDHENAPDAQVEIGWIYENAKYDLPRAKEAYQKALDRFPNTSRRREIIDSIERINSKLPK